MSKLGINTGSSPNDGQGDSLRVAMGKINHNFTEIYDTFGDGNTIVSYAGTAGISTVAENLTGRPRVEVSGILNTGITTTEHIEVRNITSTGIITATKFVGDGSQLSNVVAEWSGIDVLDNSVRKGVARELNFGNGLDVGPPDGVGRVLVSLSTSVVSGGGTGGGGTPLEFRNQNAILGEYSKLNFGENLSAVVEPLTGIVTVTADNEWKPIDLSGDHGATLGIHTTKNVGIGTTADDAYRLTINGIGTGPGTPGEGYGIRVESRKFSFIENVGFGWGQITVPSFINLVGGDQNGWNRYPLQLSEVEDPCLRVQSHARFRTTAQFGTSFYEYGSTGPILYPGVMIDGGKSTISVGFGISLNGQSGVITATEFRGYGGIFTGNVNVSGTLTATSFVGDGSGLTGLSTFSGDYNDLANKPTIPSISGLASEGYVDTQIGIRTFSGNYNDLTNQPTIPVNITDLSDVNAGSPSTGQVLKWSGSEWTAAADLVGDAGAGIGLSDLSVTISSAGINSLTYNNLTGVFNFTPTSLVGYATETYVDSAVAGVATFSGDYNDLINQPSIPSIVGLASEGYVDTQIGIKTFSGDYNDLTNQPSIPSIVGLASEGYVDTQIGIKTFSGDYNDLTNQPSIPSIAGLASEGYVDTAVAGINTFTGAATTITTTQIGNWDTAYSWGDHSTQGYLTSVAGAGGTWAVNASGIHTSKSVGIGTEISNSALWVEGDGYFSGVVTATRFESTSAGTPTIDSPNNLNINAVTVAISTNLTVGGSIVGGGQTINATGVQVTGIVTATSFKTNSTIGDGTDVGFAIKYYVTANGTSAYRFAGPGLVNTTDNPTFYLQRGFTYIFENSTGGSHPFRIQFTGTTTGVGTYVSGSQTGTQIFTVPFDAPSSYQYQCTIHGGMLGTFNVA